MLDPQGEGTGFIAGQHQQLGQGAATHRLAQGRAGFGNLKAQAQVVGQALGPPVAVGQPLPLFIQAQYGVSVGFDAQAVVAVAQHRLLAQQLQQRQQAIAFTARLTAGGVGVDQADHARGQGDDQHHHQYFDQSEALGVGALHRSAVPVADLGVQAVTAELAVGAKGEQVIARAAGAWHAVLIGIAPGIDGQALEVTVGVPVACRRVAAGLADQGFEPLLAAGVLVVVELVDVQGHGNGLDIALGGGALGLVGTAHDLGHHQGREDPENDHHHHDFNQGKTALFVLSLHVGGSAFR